MCIEPKSSPLFTHSASPKDMIDCYSYTFQTLSKMTIVTMISMLIIGSNTRNHGNINWIKILIWVKHSA